MNEDGVAVMDERRDLVDREELRRKLADERASKTDHDNPDGWIWDGGGEHVGSHLKVKVDLPCLRQRLAEAEEPRVMDAPEELRQAVATTLAPWMLPSTRAVKRAAADAVLAVPAIADALAAVETLTKVRRVSADFDAVPWPDALKGQAAEAMADIARLLADAPDTTKP